MRLLDKLAVFPQFVLPQRALSRLVQRLAGIEWAPFKNVAIRAFVAAYRVDLREAERARPEDYRSFNDFFTRSLKPGVRPRAPDPAAILSPADGSISQLGRMADTTLLQAKGRAFGVDALLAGDAATAARYRNGLFATLYLAPRNYHRVHAPFAGAVREVVYVPGALFSVNHRTVSVIDGVFARNERVILHCDCAHGPSAIILVGAMLVGTMALTCCDLRALVARRVPGRPERLHFHAPVSFARGAEIGRFNMGSTVILLLPSGSASWSPALAAGSTVRVGQALGALTGALGLPLP